MSKPTAAATDARLTEIKTMAKEFFLRLVQAHGWTRDASYLATEAIRFSEVFHSAIDTWERHQAPKSGVTTDAQNQA